MITFAVVPEKHGYEHSPPRNPAVCRSDEKKKIPFRPDNDPADGSGRRTVRRKRDHFPGNGSPHDRHVDSRQAGMAGQPRADGGADDRRRRSRSLHRALLAAAADSRHRGFVRLYGRMPDAVPRFAAPADLGGHAADPAWHRQLDLSGGRTDDDPDRSGRATPDGTGPPADGSRFYAGCNGVEKRDAPLVVPAQHDSSRRGRSGLYVEPLFHSAAADSHLRRIRRIESGLPKPAGSDLPAADGRRFPGHAVPVGRARPYAMARMGGSARGLHQPGSCCSNASANFSLRPERSR